MFNRRWGLFYLPFTGEEWVGCGGEVWQIAMQIDARGYNGSLWGWALFTKLPQYATL